ncbi:MAG: two-component system, chemotaxis family, protein-glutamate methylesterase/glutaminase [Verrucomicrobiota bacterium]
METRLLILNSDPVFQDRALGIFDEIDDVELRVVRRLPEAVSILLAENFDGFVVEGEARIALDQATNARQHFPSLNIICLAPAPHDEEFMRTAQQQKITRITTTGSARILRRELHSFVRSLGQGGTPAEGIDPCHSLIGNLNQFSAAEILQMSCLGQRSGRFTFKSGRGNSEIYLAHGSVRHAVFGSLEGESAVAEIFRWRQGRFYFEEGIISQVQSVDRPWAHLLIDNLQKLDETLELSATGPA